MITVEEESDVSAFADYVLPADSTGSSSTPLSQDSPPPASVDTILATTSAPSSPAPVASQAVQTVATTAAPVIAANAVLRVNSMKPQFRSPLVDKINADQQIYIDRFGRTGHRPLVASSQ